MITKVTYRINDSSMKQTLEFKSIVKCSDFVKKLREELKNWNDAIIIKEDGRKLRDTTIIQSNRCYYVYIKPNGIQYQEVVCEMCCLTGHSKEECPYRDIGKLFEFFKSMPKTKPQGVPNDTMIPILDYYKFLSEVIKSNVTIFNKDGKLYYRKAIKEKELSSKEDDYKQLCKQMFQCSICKKTCFLAMHLHCCHRNACDPCIKSAIERTYRGCCPLCQKRINITTFEPNTDLRNYIDQYEAIEKSVLEDTATEQPTTSPLHEAPPPESVKRTNNDSSNYMSKRL